ncbi:glycerophosphodiester phosphodiesterase family protein [Nocardioides acrostichi]|uniref:glycerophosphodiester phosphodiesterase n=1 Tax=Nocardioides acrostichi TaxID=2784339 RepID=A0A930V102_9ACTN|nr:glycerophosphodiester phosphodiesterase family protein [Nocardioides acrostichi]MBF4161730.1 glycerophosphodiester phosphodiesterase [Nocardioides acrostichi]
MQSSMVVTPAVVGHRGASAHRPEHTLEAYALAIALGADDIELDLVMSADGVLVVRHETELSRTTDVAERPDLAHLRSSRLVEGRRVEGWFADDLTWEQLSTLRTRERWPALRPGSARHDGLGGVASLDEVLGLVAAESLHRGRAIGVMIELKDCAWFAARGLPVDEALAADLARHDLDHPRSRVSVMSFEPTILQRLAPMLRVPLVQLIDHLDDRPADLAAQGLATTFRDLAAPSGLAGVERYADGIGARHSLVARDVLTSAGPRVLPSRLVVDAHREWLSVHVWTVRPENQFLPRVFRRDADRDGHGDVTGYATWLLEAGVDGLITDVPEACLLARDGQPVGLDASASGTSTHAAR